MEMKLLWADSVLFKKRSNSIFQISFYSINKQSPMFVPCQRCHLDWSFLSFSKLLTPDPWMMFCQQIWEQKLQDLTTSTQPMTKLGNNFSIFFSRYFFFITHSSIYFPNFGWFYGCLWDKNMWKTPFNIFSSNIVCIVTFLTHKHI